MSTDDVVAAIVSGDGGREVLEDEPRLRHIIRRNSAFSPATRPTAAWTMRPSLK